jgi:hypothetical protein
VDVARNLADCFQPGDFCVVPLSAASDAGGGAWYLLTGLVCIALGDNRALSPWAMGIPYAAGQLLVAGVLYFAAQEAGDES